MNALDLPIVKNFLQYVADPIVKLLWAAAVFYFVWGVFTYMRKSDDPGERIAGGNHILWSVVGIFIMTSVWGIIMVIEKTWGVR